MSKQALKDQYYGMGYLKAKVEYLLSVGMG